MMINKTYNLFTLRFTSVKLDSISETKKNNFKLIRLILSICVLITHSFLVFYGDMNNDPLFKLCHICLGDLSVKIFFIISGFLISKSYLESKNFQYFIKSRFLRIYPAVFLVNILILVMVIILSKVNWINLIVSKESFVYFSKNTFLLFDVRPCFGFDIFSSNPFPSQINPPLWTLTWELKMYLTILLIFGLGKIFHKSFYFNFLYLIMIIFCLSFQEKIGWWGIFPLYFYTGVFFYINRKHIQINLFLFLISFALLFFIPETSIVKYFAVIPISYITFYIAYIPKIKWINSERWGDYSYGIYVFSFPIQQLLVFLNISSLSLLIAVSLSLSLILAIFSWHFIESKALALKSSPIKAPLTSKLKLKLLR